MLQSIEQLDRSGSWQDVCARFGELINLEGPAPGPVVRRAFADERYAFYLLLTRDAPGLRRALLEDPRNDAYADTDASQGSQLELVGRAAKALARWSTSGFTQVDEATFERRWAACQACPRLVEAPDRVVYKGMTILAGDRRVCSACGCVARAKARIPTEHCPVADPSDASRDRWGEPKEDSQS
jgi:hypothetical protein